MRSVIAFGDAKASPINHHKVLRGDIVFCWEHSNVRRDIETIKISQAKTGIRDPISRVNELVHCFIVTKTFPQRPGIYEIAHADGATQKVVSQIDPLIDHHPGQSHLVFRMKNPSYREAVAETAQKLASPLSGHRCRRFPQANRFEKKLSALRLRLFDQDERIISPETLKKFQRCVHLFTNSGRLFDSHSGIEEMSCVEFIAIVISLTAFTILFPDPGKNEMNEEKINQTIEQLLLREEPKAFPLKFCSESPSPASFAEFLIRNSALFQLVGFLGVDPRDCKKPLDLQGKPSPLMPLLTRISHTISREGTSDLLTPGRKHCQNDKESPGISKDDVPDCTDSPRECEKCGLTKFQAIFPAMRALGMISSDGFFYPAVIEDPIKEESLRVFFENSDSSKLVSEFYFLYRRESERAPSKSDPSGCFDINTFQPLTENQLARLLNIEKKKIQRAPISRTEKTLKLSMNALQKKDPSKTNPKVQVLKKQILSAHEKIQPNCIFQLSDQTEGLNELWIRYSLDKGQTWNHSPFQRGVFKTRIPERGSILYRIFKSSSDTDCLTPLDLSSAWENTPDPNGNFLQPNEKITRLTLRPVLSKDSPPPVFPWEPQNSCSSLEEECNQLTPTEADPLNIADYQQRFQALEHLLFPIQCISTPLNGKGLEETILSIAKSVSPYPISEENIYKVKPGIRAGLSGNPVYKILDPFGRPSAVIKVVIDSKGVCLREFFVLSNHSQSPFETFQVPKPLSVHNVQDKNRSVLFLVMDHISGTSLNALTLKYISDPNQLKKSDLEHVYRKVGKSVAELHSRSQSPAKKLHPAFLDMIHLFTKNSLKKLKTQGLPQQLLQELSSFFHRRHRWVTESHFPRSYYHGDFNHGNIVYDPYTDKLAILDWPDGSLSVGKKGLAFGVPFLDLVQFKNELLISQASGLSEEDANSLWAQFFDEYKNSGGISPNQEEWDFFLALSLLGSLKWYHDKREKIPDTQQQIFQQTYQMYLYNLQIFLERVSIPLSKL